MSFPTPVRLPDLSAPTTTPDPVAWLINQPSKWLQEILLACAAELLRDYKGWQRSDFKKFQVCMIERFCPSVRLSIG